MYAVIKTGGKQYRVAAGQKIKVEAIPADIGAEITIDQVLAVGADGQFAAGTPLVAGATVSATVLAHGRHDKVRIFKMRRRKHYQKHQGHRQNYTQLLISGIASDLGSSRADGQASAGASQGQPDASASAPQFDAGRADPAQIAQVDAAESQQADAAAPQVTAPPAGV